MAELPLSSAAHAKWGEEIAGAIIDKSPAQMSHLFSKSWLLRYPRAKEIIFDNGSNFKLHFVQEAKNYE